MGYDIDLNLKCECYKQDFHSKFTISLLKFGRFDDSRGQYELSIEGKHKTSGLIFLKNCKFIALST